MRTFVARNAQQGLRASLRRPGTCWTVPSGWFMTKGARSSSSTPTKGGRERKWSTPLAKQLSEAINITGPIPLASYMRVCLTGDIGGYYTGAIGEDRDQFGRKGDFITSPEISQVFGELIGIWFVAEWMSQGKPSSGVEIIEVGPGRGTLMDDILRTISKFKDMAESVEAVYMVEASPELRTVQQDLLCQKDAPREVTEAGLRGSSRHGALPITWTETIKAVPNKATSTPFIVAHEFFDALPIHAFQVTSVREPMKSLQQQSTSAVSSKAQKQPPMRTTLQWREMVVSPTPPGSTHASLRTPRSEQQPGSPPPDFQLTLAPYQTKHATYLPESSDRYRALKSTGDALIEICPDASLYASDFATRIGGSAQHPKPTPSGAALILDYGTSSTIPINSLRGIKRHQRVSPFSEPGLVDLSADVDFTALADAALIASEAVEVHGPVDQADFLGSMGILQRAEILAKSAEASEGAVEGSEQEAKKRGEEIMSSCRRLIDRGPGGMGKLYKALAIVPENGGRRRPVGFGGDIV